ncbi:MAG TPA: hypothetical protein VN039_12675, partial [Nitrospira sp.]|nr:hypothetical protein [Nitrospira sp.]
LNHTPQNSTLRDIAFIDWGSASANAIRVSDGVNIVVDHITVLGTGPGANGVQTDDAATGVPAATNSIAMTNLLIAGITPGRGFNITGFNTWSGNEIFSTGNGTAFNPALPANWTNTSTSAHGMGTCKVWIPTGAAVKGAGTGGSDIGATILYRYVDGVLTTTPLWDPVTGAFPFGPADSDGTNRVAGDSLFDFHTRININSGGCSFPAGYGAGGGSGGTVTIGGTASGTGANSLSFPFTVSAGQDRALVCFGMRDDGSNVGSIAAADISGQALSFVKRSVTSPGWRAVEIWQVANPISGSRTVNATTTGAVSGMAGQAMQFDTTSALNTAVSASSPPNTPTSTIQVTAPTNTNELVVDCVASSSGVSITAGANQTPYPTVTHPSISIALGSSTQPGTFGGVMDDTLGGTVYAAQVAISLVASPADTPSTATLTLTQFVIRELFGAEAIDGSKPLPPHDITATPQDALTATANHQAYIGTTGAFRVRTKITGSVATTSPFGVQLACRVNAEARTPVQTTFNGKVFRLYGSDPDPDIPASLTSTTNQLCTSNCNPGAFLRDLSPYVVIALPDGNSIELEWAIQAQASVGDVIQCAPQKDDGTPLDVETVVPTVVVIDNQSAVGN